MTREKKYKKKLSVLLVILSFCFASFAITGYILFNEIIIHGKLYNTISKNKDLLADILPPPSNLVESYFNFHEILLETDSVARTQKIKKASALQSTFEQRENIWIHNSNDSTIKRLFIGLSKKAGLYFVLQDDYLKNNYQNDTTRLHAIKKTYESHRNFIDELTTYLYKQCELDEAKALAKIKVTKYSYLGFCILLLIVIIFSIRLSSKSIIVEMEERLSVQNELELLNKTKDKLFSIIAHDLKNPFNSILGLTALLKKNINVYSIDKIENYTNVIHNSAKASLNLLENLLDWAKTQTGQLHFKPEQIDITEVLEETIVLLNTTIAMKEIKLTIHQDRNIDIYADPQMLKTILRNLISNSIKYSNVGGSIIINVFKQDKSVVFTISDYGLGMSESIKNNLFVSAINQSEKGTANEQGTGLGLMICYDFIKRHNGEIKVETEINKGSDFTFTIPL